MDETTHKELESNIEQPSVPTDPKAVHEAAEAKRKSEWEVKQAEKKAAYEKVLADVGCMSDEEVMNAAALKLGGNAERPTRRSMKLCVIDFMKRYSQADPNFARKVMHPRKNMDNCIKYINSRAMVHLKEEAKASGESGGMMGGDVPDDLCYKWAAEYFKDPDAKEDKDKDDEFIPKKYYGGTSASKANTKAPAKKPAPPAEQVDLELGADYGGSE